MANPIVTSLTQYVEENKVELIAKSTLKGKSAELVNLITGVKGNTALNLLTTDVVLQDGSECSFDAEGTSEISQRIIEPKVLKVNTEFCDKVLLKTYANHLVKVGAGRETLPFEEKFIADIVAGVNAQIEKMIWQGDGDNDDEWDGFVTILEAESASTVNVSKPTGTTATDAINAVYMATPETIVNKEDYAIFVSEGMYRKYIQELVSANLYHHDATYGNGEYKIPGSNVSVIAISGLNGTANYDYVIGARKSNLYYGVDLADDAETFDFWYSKDDRVFKLAIEFLGGNQIAYLDEVVFGKVAK